MGNDGPRAQRPGLLQIMRMARSGEFQKSVEKSQLQLSHGHQMLSELMPEHDKIHATAIQEKLRKDIPEMAPPVENGLCMYRMISFLYVQKFGMDGYRKCKEKFPGVDE